MNSNAEEFEQLNMPVMGNLSLQPGPSMDAKASTAFTQHFISP